MRPLSTLLILLFLNNCQNKITTLPTMHKTVGSNHQELEAVLTHYRQTDPNPYKLRAAKFLIENMPAHYSYSGNEIFQYYDYASQILADTALTPEQQRDSLLAITDLKYRDLPNHTIPDAQIIKADFLIDNIDKSYTQWATCPWASQVTFDEYLECKKKLLKMCRIGIHDVFGESGSAADLLKKYKLDGDGVYEQVKAFV